jgi:hypothetical protein
MERGVIVGCDEQLEWALPWWWKHYSAHNRYKVAFFDFGMSPKAAAWCKERGVLLSIPFPEIVLKTEKEREWIPFYGQNIPTSRIAWFKKPFAALHTPFPLTLWLDLDCQVKSSLDPLFSYLLLGAQIALLKYPTSQWMKQGEKHYNSGVLVFQQGAKIIKEWAELSLELATEFPGDEEVLSRAINLYNPPLIEIPSIYNWFYDLPPNPNSVIEHFTGPGGKVKILLRL